MKWPPIECLESWLLVSDDCLGSSGAFRLLLLSEEEGSDEDGRES